jgi:diadenosine tetraphosphate (Ap4A) HIT family hydrolase
MLNPFSTQSTTPFVALCGVRKGYVQLSFTAETTQFNQADPQIYTAAHAWCQTLENLGAKRVYWIVLSEQVRQLHIHLYPRWQDDEAQGLALFEQRDQAQSMRWDEVSLSALHLWGQQQQIELLNQPHL